MVICFIEYYKNICFICFFMVMLGWLRNSLAAVFSWCVNNVGCFFIVSIFDGFILKKITEFVGVCGCVCVCVRGRDGLIEKL